MPEVRVVARFLPGFGDGLVNERRLDVVHRASPAAHPPDHAREHRETLFPVIAVDLRDRRVDHGEGVKARRILAERDERTAERFRGVLERAPVVDDHGFAADAHQARDQFLHEDGFAGTGFAR